MTVSLSSLLTPVTEAEALDICLDLLTTMGFNATSWQSGSKARTLVQLTSRLYAQTTDVIAQIAAGGFNGLATGGWLTALSASHYENTRVAAITTQGEMVLTSTATAPPHVIAIGDLQISTTATSTAATQTYRNTTGGTLNPGSTLTLAFEAEVAGDDANIANGSTLYMWTPLVGVTVTNPAIGTTGTWITRPGVDVESDAVLTQRNADKWAQLSYAATDGAYANWAREALPGVVTRVKVRSNNPYGAGTVDVVCATATGGISAGQATTVLDYINGTDGVGRRPINDIPSVQSAAVHTPTVGGIVTVAAAYQTTTTEAVIKAALDSYFNALDIGGTVIPPSSSGVAVYSKMVAAVEALPGVISAALTPTADIALSELQIIAGVTYAGLSVVYA